MPTVAIDGTEIYYETRGDGEPVALLNGVLMTTESWALQTAVLERRHRVILHDFRAQLRSPLGTGGVSFERHTLDLAALLDHLGVESCHLVGTSYGGEVGLLFAATYPERVRSLAVIASVIAPETLLVQQVERWAEVAGGDPRALYRFMAPTVFSNRFLTASAEAIAMGEARLAEAPAVFFADFRRLVAAFARLDLGDELCRVVCPTLMMCGEEDALKPVRYSRAIAAAIPGSELLIVPGAGHAVVVEKAEEVNTALLGFLEKHRGVSE